MNTLTIEALPQGLELTPAERAWDTYDYLTRHPQLWAQNWYGNRMINGEVRGCFAHHVVARAGHTIASPHQAFPNSVMYIPMAEVVGEIDWTRIEGPTANYSGYGVGGYVLVPTLAQYLLGYNTGGRCESCYEPRLFCPGNTLERLSSTITELFGEKVVTA